LAGGRRVPKYHIRVEAYGSVDELVSWIGLIRSFPENNSRREKLIYFQDQLMRCAALLADEKGEYKKYFDNTNDCISVVEKEIDRMETIVPAIDSFILPGGNILVSYCNIARCVCRRAERAVLKLNNTEKVPDKVCIFLNRLSDYLFVLSRLISHDLENEENRWSI
jgi:cob(I)alamin adenosyltransferase